MPRIGPLPYHRFAVPSNLPLQLHRIGAAGSRWGQMQGPGIDIEQFRGHTKYKSITANALKTIGEWAKREVFGDPFSSTGKAAFVMGSPPILL
jgi:hypothetical protein